MRPAHPRQNGRLRPWPSARPTSLADVATRPNEASQPRDRGAGPVCARRSADRFRHMVAPGAQCCHSVRDRIRHEEESALPEEPRLGLADAVRALRLELSEAIQQGEGESLRFELRQVELEFFAGGSA